jgi:hypothetical protein
VHSRWYKPICAGLAALFLAFAGYELWYGYAHLGWADGFGGDLRIVSDAAVRLFAGDQYYLSRQLVGPHPHGPTDILYPPIASWFFLPFRWLGMAGFLALWVGVIVWAVRRAAPWTWPLIALCIAWPATPLALNAGNPSALVAVGVALAMRWPGFGPLALLKPTMAPFGLPGIRSRWWWATAALLVIGSLPFLADTLIYPQVLLWTQHESGFLYSLWHWPLAIIPLLPVLRLSLLSDVRRGLERRLVQSDRVEGVPVLEQVPLASGFSGGVETMSTSPISPGIVDEPEAVPAGP